MDYLENSGFPSHSRCWLTQTTEGRILGNAHTNEFWTSSIFLGQIFPFLVGGGRILKGSHFFDYLPVLLVNADIYLPVVSVIDLQFVQNDFGFDSFSPPSVPLLSATLEALFRDLQLLQPSVVELQLVKKKTLIT